MDVELLRQIFSGIDENMDGIIDVGEFYLSLKSTSLEDSALALFNKVDKDKNGQLTMQELIQHLFPFAEGEDVENILAWVKNGDTGPSTIFKEGEEEVRTDVIRTDVILGVFRYRRPLTHETARATGRVQISFSRIRQKRRQQINRKRNRLRNVRNEQPR